MSEDQVNPKVLGQLLLMQSVLNNLPDNKSIFSFVCKGLLDIPGIADVTYEKLKHETDNNSQQQLSYPIYLGNSYFGKLVLDISDTHQFKPYENYLNNFLFMLAVILEERRQRLLNEEHQLLLEERILERTRELNLEKENLAESQRRFTDLMVNVKLLSVMLDADGNIIFCNKYLLALTKYTSEEIMGKNWFSLFLPKPMVKQVKSIFKGIINGEKIDYNYENEILTKTGERLLISWNNTLLRNANHQIIGAASIGENITERKLAEIALKEKSDEIETQNEEYLQINEELVQVNEELIHAKQRAEENEEKFRLMIANSNDLFLLINDKGEQFYISDAAARDTGFTIEELKGPIVNVIYPDDLDIILNAWNEILNKETPIRVQYRHKHKYKQYIWYEAVAQNFLNNPAIKAIVVNVREITAIKETELALTIAKEKAEESDRLKTAFLQNMSHEIRTPMNAIMGFSELLNKSFEDKPKLQKFSGIIGQRCKDLLEIINDILDIAKIESGQLAISIEEFKMRELFEELSLFFTEYQKKLGKEHIEFDFRILSNQPENIVLTDKIKLKQIFINLITNAFKFTDAGKIECGCMPDKNNQLAFFVSDTGIGIPADKQKVVFERFTQLNDGQSKYAGGTGLGLSIVKGLINLLGGEIILESAPNKGSTFSFSIPCEMKTPETHYLLIPEQHSDKYLMYKIILIVEDDYYNAEYLKEILSDYTGLTILHAENGQKAIELAIAQPVDLILMDIRLPDMDGYMAATQIRQHKPHVKIIAQTAYASQDDRQKAMNMGCNDYISKPSKQELLVSMISKHLSNQ